VIVFQHGAPEMMELDLYTVELVTKVQPTLVSYGLALATD
jgi:hypothetical protein